MSQGNVPIGDVEIRRGIVSELPGCHCKPDAEAPCGPDSDCINRHMLYECHPAVCPAGQQCLNQRFQKRQYPAVKPFRTDGRGWGLLASVNIEKVRIGTVGGPARTDVLTIMLRHRLYTF